MDEPRFLTHSEGEKFVPTCISDFREEHFIALNRLKHKPIGYTTTGLNAALVDYISFANICLRLNLLYVRENYLELTEDGYNLLKKHWAERKPVRIDPVEKHKQRNSLYSVTESEFIKVANKLPFKYTENDVYWAILGDRKMQYEFRKDYSGLYNTYYSMAHLLNIERKDSAVGYYEAVMFFDLNGFSPTHKPSFNPDVARKIYYNRNGISPLGAESMYSLYPLQDPMIDESTYLEIIASIKAFSQSEYHHKIYEMERSFHKLFMKENTKYSDNVPQLNPIEEKQNLIQDSKKGSIVGILSTLFSRTKTPKADNDYEELLAAQRARYEAYQTYRNELNSISDPYYELLERIEQNWSVLYNAKTFNNVLSDQLERDCVDSIQLYEKLCAFYKKHGEKIPPNAPAFKRLAMLYEKRGEYEMAIAVCVRAISCGERGSKPSSRLIRMAKKANRNLTDEELELVGLK